MEKILPLETKQKNIVLILASCFFITALCTCAHADYGYADSQSFPLNLLTTYQTPAYGSADSNSNFSVNLLNVRRVWADSPDMALDYADLLILAQNWLTVGCNVRNNCDGADINRDNKVDFADFARLAVYWLESF